MRNNKRSAGKQAGRAAHALPPWIASSERDNVLMARWLNERLDGIQEWLKEVNLLNQNHTDDVCEAWLEVWKEGRPELVAARHGKIEPLRKLYPEIAEYINLPKRPGKGKRFQKSEWQVREEIFNDPKLARLTRAAWDVDTIRDLWERCYRKKKRSNLPPGTGTSGSRHHLSAEDFAAARHKVEVNELCEWMRSRRLPKDLNREKIRECIFGAMI